MFKCCHMGITTQNWFSTFCVWPMYCETIASTTSCDTCNQFAEILLTQLAPRLIFKFLFSRFDVKQAFVDIVQLLSIFRGLEHANSFQFSFIDCLQILLPIFIVFFLERKKLIDHFFIVNFKQSFSKEFTEPIRWTEKHHHDANVNRIFRAPWLEFIPCNLEFTRINNYIFDNFIDACGIILQQNQVNFINIFHLLFCYSW